MNEQNFIKVIEEYRTAYIATKFPKEFEKHRYKAHVHYFEHFLPNKKEKSYTAFLQDHWVLLVRPGTMSLLHKTVPKSEYTSLGLMPALEQLLDFSRQLFLNDRIFNKKENLKLGITDYVSP